MSLAEVMLALALLGTAAVVLVAVFLSGERSLRQSEKLAAANSLAKTQLDAIRKLGLPSSIPCTYDGRVPQPPVGAFPPAPYPGNQDGRLLIKVRQEQPGLVRLEVEVFWGQQGHIAQTLLVKP